MMGLPRENATEVKRGQEMLKCEVLLLEFARVAALQGQVATSQM